MESKLIPTMARWFRLFPEPINVTETARILGIYRPKLELTEDDKAIHRAIKHHRV